MTAAGDSKAGDNESITQRAEIIKNKLEMTGGRDISVSIDGEFIIIKASTVDPPVAFERILTMGGGLSFNYVDDAYSQKAQAWAKSHITPAQLSKFGPADIIKYEEEIAKAINLPNSLMVKYYYDLNKGYNVLVPEYPVAINQSSSLTGADIAKAWLDMDEFGGQSVAYITTEVGKAKLADATSLQNKGKHLAVVVAGKVRSNPLINSPLNDGRGLIPGAFTGKESLDIVDMLKDGSLPFPVVIVEKTVTEK